MIKIKNAFNAQPTPGVVNKQPSETIPDQSLTVSQIMQRYAQGLPLEGVRVPQYEEEGGLHDFVPDNFDKLDLADQQSIREDVAEHIDKTRKNWERQQAKKQKDDKRKYKDQEIDFEEVKKPNETSKPQEGTKPPAGLP